MANRYQQAYEAVEKLKQNQRKEGHFLHVINNLATPIRGAAQLEELGELDNETRRDAEKALLALTAYAGLMNRHAGFRDAELREGYFITGERQPADPLERQAITTASNYVKYAVSRLK